MRICSILGDFYHDHDLAYKALAEAIKPWRDEIELQDVSVDRLTDVLAGKPDLVVLYKENRLTPDQPGENNWMTPEMEERIAAYTASGGSWLAWHSGLASYTRGGAYYDMLRGYFVSHPAENQIVHYRSTGDAIPGVRSTAFEAMDEHYFVECDTANTHVFLMSESIDGRSAAGWAHEYGKGRVCCLTPTHRAEGFAQPEMTELLRTCVQWCLSK